MSLLEDVIEQAWEDLGDKLGILVVGKTDATQDELIAKASERGMVVHWWDDVWTAAEKTMHKFTVPRELVGVLSTGRKLNPSQRPTSTTSTATSTRSKRESQVTR